jgi:hypothetical protein
MLSAGREGGGVTGKVAKPRSCKGGRRAEGAEADAGAALELTSEGEVEVDEVEEEKEEAEEGRGNTGRDNKRKNERG